MSANKRILVLGVGLGLLLLPRVARSEILTFTMESTIDTVSDPEGILTFANIGDRMVYTFSFDSDAPDSHPSADSAVYIGTSAELLIGSRVFEVEAPRMEIVINAYQNNRFNVRSFLDGMSGGVSCTLYDYSGAAVTSVALPSEPYPLNLFDWTQFRFSLATVPSPEYPSGSVSYFRGSVDVFVPEPSSALGLVLLLAIVRFRRI